MKKSEIREIIKECITEIEALKRPFGKEDGRPKDFANDDETYKFGYIMNKAGEVVRPVTNTNAKGLLTVVRINGEPVKIRELYSAIGASVYEIKNRGGKVFGYIIFSDVELPPKEIASQMKNIGEYVNGIQENRSAPEANELYGPYNCKCSWPGGTYSTPEGAKLEHDEWHKEAKMTCDECPQLVIDMT